MNGSPFQYGWTNDGSGHPQREPSYSLHPEEVLEPVTAESENEILANAMNIIMTSLSSLRGLRGDCWALVTGRNKQTLQKVALKHGVTRARVSKICRSIEGELKKLGFKSPRVTKSANAILSYSRREKKVNQERKIARRLLRNASPATMAALIADGNKKAPLSQVGPSVVSGEGKAAQNE